MTIPTEAAFNFAAEHGLVSGENVFYIAGEQVAIMREAVGEGRAVIEDERICAIALVDGFLECIVRFPEF